jgi:anaerobic magnesium-protoporphyrin IX monomethyl ester cyclase
MRIALVSPKWNEMVNSYPPLGLGYLAAILENEGHSVSIFDLGLDPDGSLEDGADAIASCSPDIVGITAMTNNYHSASKTCALLKARTGCPIVVGGPHSTIFPERVVSDPSVDYVAFGEGEDTMRELVKAIASEGPRPSDDTLQAVRGICFVSGDEAIRTPPRPLIEDLDALPFPARHLFELARYPLYSAGGERMVTLLSSRGCPYKCVYCFKGIVGRTYRQRSPENVIDEIRYLEREFGYRSFYFVDDLFTLDRRRLAAVCDQIIEEGLDIRWQCLARADRVTPDLLALMYRAGCREIHYGIESGNPQILARIGKGITLDQARTAVAWTFEAGILAKGYFMLGLPGDTEETIEQTIEFANNLDLDQAMFSLTTPFPGTQLWDELVARNPSVSSDQDFSRAFYYTRYDQRIEPFFNVSDVPDERLSQLAHEAQERFQEARRRRKYLRTLGPLIGRVVYALSTIDPVRRMGHSLLATRLLRRVKGLRRLGPSDLREEYARKWN